MDNRARYRRNSNPKQHPHLRAAAHGHVPEGPTQDENDGCDGRHLTVKLLAHGAVGQRDRQQEHQGSDAADDTIHQIHRAAILWIIS